MATGTKAIVLEGCQAWMSLTLSDIECWAETYVHLKPEAIKIFKLWVFLISHLPAGAAPPGFQPALSAWRNSLSTIPPIFPFTICQPWPSAWGMGLFIHCIRTGPLHMSKLFSSWIFMFCQPHMVTSGQITVTVSSHQVKIQGIKTQVKIWFTVIHTTQLTANVTQPKQSIICTSHYLQQQKVLLERFPNTYSV